MNQQQVGRSESNGYWMRCYRIGSASMRLRSCCRRTFWAYSVIKMTWYDTGNFFERHWDNNCQLCLSLFCSSFKCSLNYGIHSSIWHFKFPKVVQTHALGEVGILGTVLLIKGLFQDNPSNFYWNRFIFDEQRSKNKLAQFFWDTVYKPILQTKTYSKWLGRQQFVLRHSSFYIVFFKGQ